MMLQFPSKMAKNLKLFFDRDGSPKARGPSSEKLLMAFLESDVQGSDHICHDLMDDITAIEDESADSREFIGNAHSVVITAEGVTIECNIDDVAPEEGKTDDKKSEDTAPDGGSGDSAGENKTAALNNELIYTTGLKHFREVLEDWEAFILNDQDDLDDELPA